MKATGVAEAGFPLAFIVNPARLLVFWLGIFAEKSLREVELSLVYVFIAVGAVLQSTVPLRQNREQQAELFASTDVVSRRMLSKASWKVYLAATACGPGT